MVKSLKLVDMKSIDEKTMPKIFKKTGSLNMPSCKKVILYNPQAVFFDMPLALLAIGSILDPKKYQVIVLDARVDSDVDKLVEQHIDDAICFGTTVITGAPIKDALEMSKKVKALRPDIPVVWGGWHTSLFPLGPMQDHAFIDITVQGQGEETFKELIEHLDKKMSLEKVRGISFRKDDQLKKNPARPIIDVNSFERLNYDLIDVERYFEKKGKRQFDYVSSIGCYFRCAFCSDPFVFQRKYSAISSAKMGEELEFYQKKYRFDDLNFQDETFFTYSKRINDFASELIDRNLNFSWAATMRADQGERLSDGIWALCKQSGLRRLLIGVESGSQEMIDWLKKDVSLSQVFYCANKCRELGIAAIFPFIVGFPEESDESVAETIKIVKQLRAKSDNFDTPIFYFKPYPGSTITKIVVDKGFDLPQTTEEWGDFDYIGSSGPWVSQEKEKFFEAFKFYLKLGYGRNRGPLLYPLRKLSQWRCRNNQFKFPIEKFLIEKKRPKQQLS